MDAFYGKPMISYPVQNAKEDVVRDLFEQADSRRSTCCKAGQWFDLVTTNEEFHRLIKGGVQKDPCDPALEAFVQFVWGVQELVPVP